MAVVGEVATPAEEEVKSATSAARSDILLATALTVVLEEDTEAGEEEVIRVEAMVVAVADMAEDVAAVRVVRPVTLVEGMATCRATALRARSATTVSSFVSPGLSHTDP